jgi:hypothetical protein
MIKVLFVLRSFVLWLNYVAGNYKITLWLIGDARSGTTWISSLLNYDNRLREYFEPFHPKFNKKVSFLKTYEYISPSDFNPELNKVAKDIFSGNFFDIRADRSSKSLFYNGLLVKDIVVNLYAFYLWNLFPKVKVLLLLRNPFSVALSKNELQEWNWESYDIQELMKDSKLYKEHLEPFKDLITNLNNEDDYIIRSVLFWCIFNYVPLRQFSNSNLEILLYEDLLMNPAEGIMNLRKRLGLKVPDAENRAIPKDKIENPSVVTTKTGDFKSNFSSWKSKISTYQYETSLEILSAFGMDNFYDEDGLPIRESIHDFIDLP